MADTEAKESPTKELKTPSNVFNEIGNLGLKYSNNHIYEESKVDLVWPRSIKTFKQMYYDASVSSAYLAIKALVNSLEFEVQMDATESERSPEQNEQVKLIEQCMEDMNVSFNSFIASTNTKMIYGFAPHEKVYKYCNGDTGRYPSKFSDGKVRWAKLAPRSQSSIVGWKFDSKVRKLTHMIQNVSSNASNYRSRDFAFIGDKDIPMSKILNFTNDSTMGNPEGRSPLVGCYLAWRYKTAMEELESLIVSRDLNGIPIITLPPEYMSEDADASKKIVYKWAMNAINNLHNDESMGLVMPTFVDPTTKAELFGFRLESVKGSGGKSYDTEKIISRYESKILMAFLADVLSTGENSLKAFSISDNKESLLQVGIEAMLSETLELINRDLVRETLKLNGYKIGEAEIPRIGYKTISSIELETLGKFVQQTVSVGALEVDENLSDELRKRLGIPDVDRSKPIKDEMIGGGSTRAGDGMKTSGEGTATKVGGVNASTANKDNK